MNRIVVIGKGGHARAVEALLVATTKATIHTQPVEIFDWRRLLPGEGVVIGLGNNDMALRERLFMKHEGILAFAHTDDANPGTIIFGNVSLGVDVAIGRNVVIYPGCVIEHGSTVHNQAWLSPSVTLCGNVTVKRRAFLGAGAIVLPGVTIGAEARIGAGAVIHDNVADGVTVYGPVSR